MKKLLIIITAALMLVAFTGIAFATNPRFKIEINSQKTKAVVQSGETAQAKLKIYPASKKGREANYFVWARSGNVFYFLQPDKITWDPGMDIYANSNMPAKNSSYTDDIIINLPDLPEGTYILYVGVFVDSGIYYDTIILDVLPPNIINGICGSANGMTLISPPEASTLCSSGTAGSVNGQGPWYWTCYGAGGGTDAECSVNKEVPVPGIGDDWVRFELVDSTHLNIYFNNLQITYNTTTNNSIAHPFHFGTYNDWVTQPQTIFNSNWGYVSTTISQPATIRFTYGGDNTGQQGNWSWVTTLAGSQYYWSTENNFCVKVEDNIINKCQ